MTEGILNISMQWLTIECYVCECIWHQAQGGSYGIPIWNGMIVANDWPGEWGGVPVCKPCYERHERGELTEMPTSDYDPAWHGHEINGG